MNYFQKEKDFLQILDKLADGLFTIDKKGRIKYSNTAPKEITDLSASEVMGL